MAEKKVVSFDRLFAAAKRGSVLFINSSNDVSASRHIEEVFRRTTFRRIIGVYDERCDSKSLFDDLVNSGFNPQ